VWWEYCRLKWDADKEEGRVDYADSSRTSIADPVKDVFDALEKLGLEGWELVSHAEISYPVAHEVYIFKRPVVK
jgi:hypothetical protein